MAVAFVTAGLSSLGKLCGQEVKMPWVRFLPKSPMEFVWVYCGSVEHSLTCSHTYYELKQYCILTKVINFLDSGNESGQATDSPRHPEQHLLLPEQLPRPHPPRRLRAQLHPDQSYPRGGAGLGRRQEDHVLLGPRAEEHPECAAVRWSSGGVPRWWRRECGRYVSDDTLLLIISKNINDNKFTWNLRGVKLMMVSNIPKGLPGVMPWASFIQLRWPLIMQVLSVYTEPEEADITPPLCVILDIMQTFWNQMHDSHCVSLSPSCFKCAL